MNVQFTPFIWLDGEGQEAIRFYEKALDAQIVFRHTYAESPEAPKDLSDEAKNRLDHSVLTVGRSKLYVADRLPGETSYKGSRVAICLETKDVQLAERYFHALAEEGSVVLPFQEQYFSPGYGEVVDKYGVMFLIFTERPD